MQFNKKFIVPFIVSGFLLVIVTNSCYYDNAEVLYPGSTCDTTAASTYSTSVAPIMSSYCNSCHSGASPSGSIKTDTYASVKTLVDNGKLWGAINQVGVYSPMPKNGNKLNTCNLAKIDKWIKAGAANN